MSEDHLLTPSDYSSNSRKASVYNSRSGIFGPNCQKNNNSYKTQPSCAICQVAFSKFSENPIKRHCCQFCYNAVCKNCSPLTQFNEVTCNDERICMDCFKLRSREEAEQHLTDELRQSLDNETELRLIETRKRKELQEEVDKKNQLISELNEKLHKAETSIQEHERKIKEDEKKNEEFRLEVLTLKKENERSKEEFIKLNEENQDLKKKLVSGMRDTKASSCGCLIT